MTHAYHIIDVRIGQRVHSARKCNQLTVETLAHRVGLEADALIAIEAGAERPSAAQLFCLSRELGVELRSFFAESCEMNYSNALDLPQAIRTNQSLSELVENMRSQTMNSRAA